MRELFDEVAGQSPFDPEEAVRRATRVPQRKRFYTSAGVGEADGGFTVTLDGKPIRNRFAGAREGITSSRSRKRVPKKKATPRSSSGCWLRSSSS